MVDFKLVSKYKPAGDQPQAIKELKEGFKSGKKFQTLLGATGTGKTFTMANIIADLNIPTLVLAPNKLLAAQLYQEYKDFFPNNSVNYYISYFDYYQPEAFLPDSGMYIEKDSSVNEQIMNYRLASTYNLMTRSDVIIISSISCIYGIGNPTEWSGQSITLEEGMKISRRDLLLQLITIRYERNDVSFYHGKVRVRGDVVDIFPGYLDTFYRISFWGDEIESIYQMEPIINKKIEKVSNVRIFPNSEFVAVESKINLVTEQIKKELDERLQYYKENNKYVEAQRLEERTLYDISMLKETGFCKGIENYSKFMDQRESGTPPACLLDYFPEDYFMIIDESHIAIPQVHGMIGGDVSRKTNLVEYGFRLPSALDNRPLNFKEWEEHLNYVCCTSATPSEYEVKRSNNKVVDQVVRPTGLVDPEVIIKPVENQIDDLLSEINIEIEKGHRVLVTTLTKKLAENITDYYNEIGLKIRYLHSEIDTVERMDLVRQLRMGEFDVLVGINLLREGLDIPEVGLVAILDGDKAGFLRDTRSLIQTIGRASRNSEGRAIIYADHETAAIKQALEETNRRREKQQEYNKKHNITPQTIKKNIQDSLKLEEEEESEFDKSLSVILGKSIEQDAEQEDILLIIEKEMKAAAEKLDFEGAVVFRDLMLDIQNGNKTIASIKKNIEISRAKKSDQEEREDMIKSKIKKGARSFRRLGTDEWLQSEKIDGKDKPNKKE